MASGLNEDYINILREENKARKTGVRIVKIKGRPRKYQTEEESSKVHLQQANNYYHKIKAKSLAYDEINTVLSEEIDGDELPLDAIKRLLLEVKDLKQENKILQGLLLKFQQGK